MAINAVDHLSDNESLALNSAWDEKRGLAVQAAVDGQSALSEMHWLAALQLSMKFPEGDMRTVQTLEGLASACLSQNKGHEAEVYLGSALKMKERALGAHHASVAEGWQKLGNCYQQFCKYKNAAGAFEKSLAIYEEAFDRAHVLCGTVCASLARAYYSLDDLGKADHYFRRAIVTLRGTLGDCHANVVELVHDYSAMLEFAGKPQEAHRVAALLSKSSPEPDQ